MSAAGVDVLIVGAGVAGASVAFHLARLGAGSVLVLDRETVGSGMSSRSSALVRMHYSAEPEVQLAVRSDTLFEAWSHLTGQPSCVRRTGFARIVLPGEEHKLRANVAMQQRCGAATRVVDAAELAELANGMRTDDLTYAAWEAHGGYGDGAIVASDLLAAARNRGAEYRPHTPVTALLRSQDRVTGVQLGAEKILAEVVVLAAGVWSPPLLAAAGVDLPIETEFHQVAVLTHEAGQGATVACIDSTTQTYFRPEAGGTKTLVGSFVGPRGVDPDEVPATAKAAGLESLIGAAARRVPALADAGIAGGVTGVYDMTPDARPMLGEVPGVPGMIVATGFSGTGFKISPAVGEAIAEFIVSGGPSQVDITPFRPGRFEEGAPIQPPFAYSDE
ncbi:MAG TPA: FAD-binding oxidoreductase [Streptosporangiaceae bacterium]|nr:FAD-binding oxidoreductase [Streptosporangiaceae bacterium]